MARQVLDGLDGIVSVLRRKANEEIDADGALAVIAQTRSLLTIIFNRNEEDPAVTPLAIQKRDRTMAAADYIDQHLDQKLSMPALAAIAGMSEPVLGLSFREVMGCSPNQYAQMRKSEKALRLAEEGELAMSEIASQCGLDDVRDVEALIHRHEIRQVGRTAPRAVELRRVG